MSRAARVWAAALAAPLALAGCGLGAGDESAGVHLRVTDEFDNQTVEKVTAK